MTTSVSGVACISLVSEPSWGPGDPGRRRLETVGDMVQCSNLLCSCLALDNHSNRLS